MLIRKATAADATEIAPLLLLAMEDIVYHFIGQNDYGQALNFLTQLCQEENNQYSFQNCWVIEINNHVGGVALVYDGAHLHALRKPVATFINKHFHKEFAPEDETQAGEFYIDCIGVNPQFQGRGIGSQLLHFLQEEYVTKHKQSLGLLVDKDNPAAKKLYLKLGFKAVDTKILAEKEMEHLQYSIS
jgi:ribosomal protein S18 acetylase RimI-like enzyme